MILLFVYSLIILFSHATSIFPSLRTASYRVIAYKNGRNVIRSLIRSTKKLDISWTQSILDELSRRISIIDAEEEILEDEAINNEAFDSKIDAENKDALNLLLDLLKSDGNGWKEIAKKDGITVERRSLPAGKFVSKEDAEKGFKHACVRTRGIINASPAELFALFQANDLVSQYNDHVKEMRDLKQYAPQRSGADSLRTKLTWSCTLYICDIYHPTHLLVY